MKKRNNILIIAMGASVVILLGLIIAFAIKWTKGNESETESAANMETLTFAEPIADGSEGMVSDTGDSENADSEIADSKEGAGGSQTSDSLQSSSGEKSQAGSEESKKESNSQAGNEESNKVSNSQPGSKETLHGNNSQPGSEVSQQESGSQSDNKSSLTDDSVKDSAGSQAGDSQDTSNQAEENRADADLSEATQKDATRSEGTQTDAANAEGTQTDATNPEGTQADASRSEGTQKDASQSEGTQAGTTQSESTQTDSSQPVEQAQNTEGDSSTATHNTVPTGVTGGHLVMIDPGHQVRGNSDKEPNGPGSSSMKAKVTGGTSGKTSGLTEYQLNLAVGLKLKDELIRRGYTVMMTRESNDVDISNAERAQMANNAGAEAFIRIHANGSDDTSVNGAMTICQTPSNSYNAGSYEASRRLSDCVLSAFTQATGCKKQYVWETDTMTGINWATVPSTIIEMGYMTNPTEDLNMASEDYQNKMAQGIANGIDEFFK